MLGGSLFKPKWQHKNPQVRRAAIISMDVASAEAQQIFEQLAQQDPDAEIRALAVKRLRAVPVLVKLLAQSDKELAHSASQSLLRLCQQGLEQTGLNTLLAALPDCEDEVFLHDLARQASQVELRQMALDKLNKPSLLAEMALNDADADLRLAALKRIDKVSTLQRIAKASRRKDKTIYAQAQQQLQALQLQELLPPKLQQQAQRLLGDLNAVVKLCQDKQQWIASEAQVNGLKQEWTQITQQWNELELDYELGLDSQIDQQLGLFATQLNQAQQTQQAQQAAYQQDIDVIARHRQLLAQAETIKADCEQGQGAADELLRSWHSCQQQWQQLTPPLSDLGRSELATLTLRYGDLGQAIERELSAAKQQRQWQRKAEQLEQNIQALLGGEELPSAKQQQKLQKQWDKLLQQTPTPSGDAIAAKIQQINHKLSQLQQGVEQAHQQRKENGNLFRQALADLQHALQEGKAKHAVNMLRRCEKLLPQSDIAARDPLQAEFQRVRGQARELQDWRNWSNSPVKDNICAEVEAILQDLRESSDLSYTKIRQQIRDYRQEWTRLSQTESQSDKSLWRRFDALCKEAEKYCDQFFEQRDEQRKDNLQVRQQYCEQLAQYAEHMEAQAVGDIDIKTLDTVIRTAQNEWRQIGLVNNKEKEAINQTFNQTLSRLRDIQSAYRQENRDAKLALIARLENLNADLDANQASLVDAVETTKQIQAQWKNIGPASKEKDLWQNFQALGNKVFARLDQQREQQKQERAQEAAELDAIIAELEQACQNNESMDLASVKAQLQQSREKWQAQAQRKFYKGHQKRFDRAMDQLQALKKTLQAHEEIEKRRQWVALFEQLNQLEAQAPISSPASAAELLTDIQSNFHQRALELETFIKQLYLSDAEIQTKDAEVLSQRRHLCIAAEVLAGISSPEQDKTARMQYQVSLLAEKMKQGEVLDEWQQFSQFIRQWWGYGTCRADSSELQQRFRRVAETFLRT